MEFAFLTSQNAMYPSCRALMDTYSSKEEAVWVSCCSHFCERRNSQTAFFLLNGRHLGSGARLPARQAVTLRLGYLMRCLNPLSPKLIRDEFLHHRLKSPWFSACLRSLCNLPQPKTGLSLCDRLSTCIEALSAPAVELPATFSHPLPDSLHAVLVTDGSAVIDEQSSAGPAGWGYILFHRGITHSACGPLGMSTSDNAESTALLHGLLHCQRLRAPFIHVRTDNMACKELLDGTSFPESPGCLRLYLALVTIDAKIFPYKVFSHSAPPHRDILNDLADELAARGRSGITSCVATVTTPEHLAFLQRPIPRYNPGRDDEAHRAPPVIETSHTNALSSFQRAVQSSARAWQMSQHLDTARCNIRWINFPGCPPAIIKASIMNQHFLYHLRYDQDSHFARHPSLYGLRTPCPLCNSEDNSGAHRIFDCRTSSSVISTQDVMSLVSYRRALCAYRSRYTSLLPLGDDGSEYPRSDQDYLFWLCSPHMLIADLEAIRALSYNEMQSLATASCGVHSLYVKYSVMTSSSSNSNSALVPIPRVSTFAPHVRSPTPSDVSLMCSRLSQCRLYDEVVDWYKWHGYAYSSTNALLHRVKYEGWLPMSLLDLYMKLEVLLSACLCAYPAAGRSIVLQHCKPGVVSPCISLKVYNLLRAGNPLSVPVSDRSVVYERPFRTHLDVPDFFYSLPFHYYTTSALVEAWFAAPSATDRRQLIDWPPFADAAGTINCPIWKLYDFELIPKALYTRPGTRSGNKKDPRASLHPRIDMIYRLLKRAVLSGHVRITWRTRFKLLVDEAESKSESTACVLRRQLLLSLIFGDVRDVPAYKPRDAPFGYAYDFTSTVQEVLCIPICYQNIRVSHIPGFSLPVRGPPPHAPRFSFYLGVKSQTDAYKSAFLRATPPPDREPQARHTAMTQAATAAATTSDAALAVHRSNAATAAPIEPDIDIATSAAIDAMTYSATIWARELIDGTRDPFGPDCHTFPALDKPAPSQNAAELPARSATCFSDDEAEAEQQSSSDED